MRKFLALLQFAAMTSKISGKRLDDLTWEDLLVLFASDQWVGMFEEMYEMF